VHWLLAELLLLLAAAAAAWLVVPHDQQVSASYHV
jgi:hypothetical protein